MWFVSKIISGDLPMTEPWFGFDLEVWTEVSPEVGKFGTSR